MVEIPESVRGMDRELHDVFGGRLRSLVIYGRRSAAPKPIRTMAVVDSLTEPDLRACGARVKGWHDAGLATPLFVVAGELDASFDAFALEFAAIIADHQVVNGADPFLMVNVDPADVRRACEVQARSHLLHLRQGRLETRGNADGLAILVVESAAALAALLSSVARLEGRADVDTAGAGRHAERVLGVAGGTLTEVVNLARVHEIPASEAERLFPPYLAAMEKLVEYVDGWSEQ